MWNLTLFFLDLDILIGYQSLFLGIWDIISRDGRGSYFLHGVGRGGEGQGQKSMRQGGAGNPPFPTVRGRAGKGSKSAGWGGAGAGNIPRVSPD